MAEPNGSMVRIGAGTLWIAPLGTVEPAAGVLTPVTPAVSGGTAVGVPWPAAWTQLGYTKDGSEFSWAPKLDAIKVAEVLLPLRYVASETEASLMFDLAELTAAHLATAFNGGSVVTASGVTTFTPPVIGAEVSVMLGWDSVDGLERIIARKCVQTGDVKQEHKKSPVYNGLPCKFMLQVPANYPTTQIFTHYLDASLAVS